MPELVLLPSTGPLSHRRSSLFDNTDYSHSLTLLQHSTCMSRFAVFCQATHITKASLVSAASLQTHSTNSYKHQVSLKPQHTRRRHMTSPTSNTRKRTLTFVSEGVTDLETQRAREQVEQAKFEAECKRRDRKSLREQLKANAINKQKEFNGRVKERDDVNRLSGDDLAYIKNLADQHRKKELDLKHYLDTNSQDFHRRQQKLAQTRHQPDSSLNPGAAPHLRGSSPLAGVLKRDKRTKKKLRLKLARPASKET